MGTSASFKLAPAIFSDLTKFISPSALEVADLSGIGGLVSALSFRLMTSSGVSKVTKALQAHYPSLPVEKKLSHSLADQLEENSLSDGDRQKAADQLISLYFMQLNNAEGLFVDVRPKNLFYDQTQQKLVLKPSSAWLKFGPGFSSGLSELYTGFYEGKEDLFEQGLRSLRMTPASDTPESMNDLKQLFKNHFGTNLTATTFSLKVFYESFHQIFEFFKKEKITLAADFVTLGMLLTTLYVSLEQLDKPINVQKLYLDVLAGKLSS